MIRLVRSAPAAALALVSALLFFPYLTNDGLPLTADGVLHLHRALLWRWTWNEGIWWPRWHTLLVKGLGYPIFTFTPPFVYAATAVLQTLFPPITALKLFLALAAWAYALGMYAWAREHLPPGAAFVAAVAYTLAPYRFRELFVQGNYQQFWAWSLFPWVALTWKRLVERDEHSRALGAAAFTYGVLLVSHHVSTLIFSPFLALYVMWLMATAVPPGQRRRAAIQRVGKAAAVAVGLGALYWGPALAERSLIALDVAAQGFFDPARHFISVRELFSPVPRQDTRAYNPVFPFTMGPVHAALAGVGALTVLSRSPALWWRDVRTFSTGAWLLALFMMVPASAPLWNTVPLLAYAQFPTRFYGPAFLFSSLLVGFGVAGVAVPLSRSSPRALLWHALVASMAVLALAASVMPFFFQWRFAPVETTPAAVVRYEQRTGTVGTTAAGEFLPVSPRVVATLPPGLDPSSLRRTAFVNSPSGLTGRVEAWGAHSLAIRYRADRDLWATLPQFAFPGWRAHVDGRPVPVERDPATGLLRVRLLAGEHLLRVRMGNPPVRIAGALIALTSGLVLLLWARPASGPGRRGRTSRPASDAITSSAWHTLPWLTVALLLLLRLAWEEPFKRRFVLTSPPDVALPATYPINTPLERVPVALIGYDLNATRVRQGDTLDVRLFWQPLARLEANYAAFAQLVAGPAARPFAGSDTMPPGNVPTTAWDPALYIIDEHSLRVPDDAPPIPYRLLVGLYDPQTLERVGAVELPTSVRVRSRWPVRPTGRPVGARFGDDNALELVSVRLEPRGEEGTVLLTLFWRARARPRRDYQIFIHVVDSDGTIVTQADASPVNGLYPFSQWEPGELLADVHPLNVPPDAEAAAIKVGLYELDTGRRLPAWRASDKQRLPEDAVVLPFEPPE